MICLSRGSNCAQVIECPVASDVRCRSPGEGTPSGFFVSLRREPCGYGVQRPKGRAFHGDEILRVPCEAVFSECPRTPGEAICNNKTLVLARDYNERHSSPLHCLKFARADVQTLCRLFRRCDTFVDAVGKDMGRIIKKRYRTFRGVERLRFQLAEGFEGSWPWLLYRIAENWRRNHASVSKTSNRTHFRPILRCGIPRAAKFSTVRVEIRYLLAISALFTKWVGAPSVGCGVGSICVFSIIILNQAVVGSARICQRKIRKVTEAPLMLAFRCEY